MTTIREISERIVTLSENVHSEQVSRLRAIHVLSETLIDLLDAAEFVGLDETEMVAFRLVTDAVPEPGVSA